MPTRNVNLTDYYDKFIETRLRDGKYQNASEVIRAGLSALEYRECEDELKLERLRAEIQKGNNAYLQGDYVTLNTDEELEGFFDEIENELND